MSEYEEFKASQQGEDIRIDIGAGNAAGEQGSIWQQLYDYLTKVMKVARKYAWIIVFVVLILLNRKYQVVQIDAG
eukprot:CAMPEP_0197066706 /NCGR_PEP_ID=MMETSP1384-20130603/175460_1 /TAXON_ID=29189 /ORGANISM="Ammonia sp." /LENGTH=74 /DNA_ID=CAMNT_0042503947 /DNA_START=1 /DNA_END=222 /DNA_ORIENTATION=-